MQLKITPRRSETGRRINTLQRPRAKPLPRSSHGRKAVKRDLNEMAQSPEVRSHRSDTPFACGKQGCELWKAR
jgi:hypothetical protein